MRRKPEIKGLIATSPWLRLTQQPSKALLTFAKIIFLMEDAVVIIPTYNEIENIENYTNYILFARDKEYRLIDGCVRVYDFPINSEVTLELESENKTLYTNYSLGYTNDLITLNVGYVDPAEIPQDLIEVAYEIIELMYYEKETNKSHLNSLSSLSHMTLNQYKRFII